jgi:RNA polymerase sigma-70 factor (sigma-E family)
MAQMAAASDQRLLHEQFEGFVKANGDRLLHTAYGLCGDWQQAEDLVQSVLVRIVSRWDRITGDPLGYAYRCLVRANIDRWRVARRRPEVVTDPASIAALGSSAEHRSTTTVDGLGVLEFLRALPTRQRAIVVLRYLQDLSESQTADALGISVGAVKSGASRGLARLRIEMNSAPEVNQ